MRRPSRALTWMIVRLSLLIVLAVVLFTWLYRPAEASFDAPMLAALSVLNG